MKRNKTIIAVSALLITFVTGATSMYFMYKEKYGIVRSATTAITQIINPGILSTDVVDASYEPVASPTFAMTDTTVKFSCQTTTGTLGTSTQQIYVENPDAADGGWTLTIAATSGATAYWNSAVDYDFNDPDTLGCEDGATDPDSLGGQLTINPSVGTLVKATCRTCGITGITKGSSSAFNEGTLDSITLLSAAAASDDIGNWVFTGVGLSQTIPPEQPAANDYSINLTITVTAV